MLMKTPIKIVWSIAKRGYMNDAQTIRSKTCTAGVATRPTALLSVGAQAGFRAALESASVITRKTWTTSAMINAEQTLSESLSPLMASSKYMTQLLRSHEMSLCKYKAF